MVPSSGRRDSTHDPVGGHPARYGANVAVLKGPVRPQRDLNGLFAVGGGTSDVLKGYVDDSEPHFGFG